MTLGSPDPGSASARFDAAFDGPDGDLIVELVGRIEGPEWRREHIESLSLPEAHVVLLCRFDGLFGNGGLSCWFENDAEPDRERAGEALRAVGLDDAAEALDAAYALLPTRRGDDEQARRIAALRDSADAFEPLEARLWRAHAEVEERAARYARRHREAFERLRHTRPWNSLTGEFEGD